MAKILEFRRVKKEIEHGAATEMTTAVADYDISAVLNDYSLTASNRHYILENMLMNLDDELEGYKKELEKAERKLDSLVKAAEMEIATAYGEFETHVKGLTYAVRKLTGSSPSQGAMSRSAGIGAERQDQQTGPQ